VNPLKGKKLTNVRASGTDDAVRLTTPVKMSLEEAIAYIDDDELVEVTPNAIRLRKRFLDPHERKRFSASTSTCPWPAGRPTSRWAGWASRKSGKATGLSPAPTGRATSRTCRSSR
jgi:hypothetical protein